MKKYFALFTAILFFATQARATTILPINLVQLSHRAATILSGTVTDLRLVEEDHKIVQYVTIAVDDWIKGEASSDNLYIFSQIAPVENGFGLNAELPSYTLGKTYLWFLPATQDGPVAPIGGLQGVFALKNGQIPELTQRHKLLRKNLPEATSSPNAALIHKTLGDSSLDTSYATFRSAIVASFDLP